MERKLNDDKIQEWLDKLHQEKVLQSFRGIQVKDMATLLVAITK